jgi:hypothetical protein
MRSTSNTVSVAYFTETGGIERRSVTILTDLREFVDYFEEVVGIIDAIYLPLYGTEFCLYGSAVSLADFEPMI